MVKIEGEAHFKTEAQRAYHRKLRALHLAEGYSYDADTLRPRPYWPTQPKNDVAPHLWRWQDLHATLREAGELVGLGHHESRDASKLSYDRRVIALTNPGLDDHYAITTTFFADFQLIQKGECTPSHRHTPCTQSTGGCAVLMKNSWMLRSVGWCSSTARLMRPSRPARPISW